MAWDGYALFLLGGGIAGVAVGLLVLVLGPTRPANQVLTTILMAQGLFPQGIFKAVVEAGGATPWLEGAIDQGIVVAIASLGFLHFLFIGQAIPHRSVAWCRTAGGATGIVTSWVAVMAALLAAPASFELPLMVLVLAVALAAAAYSAVAAWLMIIEHEPGSVNRRRATTYFAAFVTRDVGLAWMTLATAAVGLLGIGDSAYVIGRSIMLLSHLLIAFALLRGQVLGLNRKIVTGTSGALTAALLATVFVLATEMIEDAVSGGDRAAGIAAAVVLTLLFRPLQAAGERALVRLFPSARPLAAMGLDEKVAVYREQVELAWADGEVGQKERRMLERMAVSLGLAEREAAQVEAGLGRLSTPGPAQPRPSPTA